MNAYLRRAATAGAAAATAIALAIASAPASQAADADDDGHGRSMRLAQVPFFGARIVVTTDGIVISHVVDDSPAAQAGLHEGDEVLSINGVELDKRGALREALQGAVAGDEVTVEYSRSGEEATATVTLADASERPAPPAPEDVPWVGAALVRYEDGAGVLVKSVEAGSPADAAGLLRGDVVTAINGTEIEQWWQAREIIRELTPGTDMTVAVSRDDQTMTLSVTLGSAADAPARPGPEGRGHGMEQTGGSGMMGDHGGRDGEGLDRVRP